MAINLETTTVTAATYTILVNDDVILVNFTGPVTIFLPTGSAGSNKKSYYIKDISGLAQIHPITIIPNGGRLIDGIAFAMLNGGYSHIQVISNGTKWFTIA